MPHGWVLVVGAAEVNVNGRAKCELGEVLRGCVCNGDVSCMCEERW